MSVHSQRRRDEETERHENEKKRRQNEGGATRWGGPATIEMRIRPRAFPGLVRRAAKDESGGHCGGEERQMQREPPTDSSPSAG